MRNLFKQSHADVAAQFANDPETRHDTSMIKKFMVAGAVSIGLVAGGMHPAKADDLTYGRIIGGAAGALIGGVATKHVRDSSVRASALVMTGAIGAMVGENVAKNASAQQQQRVVYQNAPQPAYQNNYQQPARVVYEQPARVVYEQPARVYEQPVSRQPQQLVGAHQADGTMLFTGDQLDMPKIVSAALSRTGTLLVEPGQTPLSDDPVGMTRLAEATRKVMASAGTFAARKDKWDDAATLVGAEGNAARMHAANDLGSARSALDGSVKEWAQVRNVLAKRGLDVARVDNALRERLANVQEADDYNFSAKQSVSYRY